MQPQTEKLQPYPIIPGRAVGDEDPKRRFSPVPEEPKDPHPSDEEHYDRIPHPGGAPDIPEKDR